MVQYLDESKHAGEFIEAEFDQNFNREVGTVSSGQNLVDGTIVQLTGGELVAKATTLDTEGDFVVPIEGIVIGNWNASSTGTNADIPNVPYLKRGPAVVSEAMLTFPAGTPQRAQAIEDLAALGIICR
jgi:hypothetical protein